MKLAQHILVLAVVAASCASGAATFTENFAADPAANGWQIFGDTNLFQWDDTNQNLRVTWDSSRPNSYFHRPLGTILTREDDFSLGFDIVFEDYAAGVAAEKPGAFEAAVGFLSLDQAAQTNFSRGAGNNPANGPRNLVEFDFFPSFFVFSPTIAQTLVATNSSNWLYNHDNLQEMTPGETFRVTMNYIAASHTLTTVISNNGAQYGLTQTILVTTNFDFRVASLSVSSYSDEGQDQSFPGSILAHGTVDNLSVTVPPPPVGNLDGSISNGLWTVLFASRTDWLYTLERTTTLANWAATSGAIPGSGGTLVLQDTNPPTGNAIYRVRANRP